MAVGKRVEKLMDLQTETAVASWASSFPWWEIVGGIGGLAIGVGSFFVSWRIWKTQQGVLELAKETKRGNDARAAPVPLVLWGRVTSARPKSNLSLPTIRVYLTLVNAGDVPMFVSWGEFHLGRKDGDPVVLKRAPYHERHDPGRLIPAHSALELEFTWQTDEAERFAVADDLKRMELQLFAMAGALRRTVRCSDWNISVATSDESTTTWAVFPKPSSVTVETTELTGQLLHADDP